MKRFYCLIILFAATSIVSNARKPEDTTYIPTTPLTDIQKYVDAYNMNERKDYLGAFKAFDKYDREISNWMAENNILEDTLNDNTFTFPFWQTKKSKAETAYMLGLANEMDSVAEKLSDIMLCHKFENDATMESCYADILKIRGNIMYLKGLYADGERYLLTALNMKHYDTPFANAVRGDLAQLYYKAELYHDAACQIDSIMNSMEFSISSHVSGNENDLMLLISQKAMCLARLGRYDKANNIMESVIRHFRNTRDKRLLCEAIRKAAKILMLKYESTGAYDSQAAQYYKEYLRLTGNFIDENFISMTEGQREEFWMTEQPFMTDCYRLEGKESEMLYNVALFGKGITLEMGKDFDNYKSDNEKKAFLTALHTKWEKVKNALPEKSAAIEFICYDVKGRERIAALVVTKHSAKPSFIPISYKDSLLQHTLQGGITVGEAMTETDCEYKNALYQDPDLPGIIWNDDLIKTIKDCRNIYFSPDGIFHVIAIEYLLPSLMNSMKMHRLTSTRIIANRDKQKSSEDGSLLLCGGIDFSASDYTYCDTEKENDWNAYNYVAAQTPWLSYLPGSRNEIDAIARTRQNSKDMYLYSSYANEYDVRIEMERHNIIHLSTHGYFFDAGTEGTELRSIVTDKQLSRSCLFLSGSAFNIYDAGFDPTCLDGILSAREIAKLNLVNVDFVVLSACQTGLGYLTGNGIYGLQRAFKAAGAKAVISSLWEVDDEATSLFMTQMYKGIANGESLHEAFYNAREYMKSSVATASRRRPGLTTLFYQKSYNEPRYTDAFILVDGF